MSPPVSFTFAMGILRQHSSQANKSPLEQLPIELFRQITSYLAFFDKKAIQVTSKKCYTLIGPVMCPHILLWMLHCCRSGMPSCRSSNLKSDVIKLNALTLDCLTRDTWIDLSQGQEAQDAHLAFLDRWDTVSPPEISDSSRRCIMYLLSLEPKTSGWQQTVHPETRFRLLQKMFVLPQLQAGGRLLTPSLEGSRIWPYFNQIIQSKRSWTKQQHSRSISSGGLQTECVMIPRKCLPRLILCTGSI